MLPIDLLEGFERKMAAFQKRPACNVDIASLPEEYDDITSLYIREKKYIIFNDKYYNDASEIEIMGALFHEIRHAYQHHIIESENTNQEPIKVIEQWKKDFDSYIQPINKDILQLDLDVKDFFQNSVLMHKISSSKILVKLKKKLLTI